MKKLFLILLIFALALPALAEDCLCTQIDIPIEECTFDGGVAPTESSSGREPNYYCPHCGRLLYPGAEIPPLASNQQSVPEPEPEPEPAPAPAPAPEPEPAPAPEPQPEPAPVIEPQPEPAPAPAPVQEDPVIPASQPEPAAPAAQEAPVVYASEPEPAASSMSLPPVPSVQEPAAADQAYIETNREEEASEAAQSAVVQSAPETGKGPVSRRKILSIYFPYRHYLLKPTPAVCPHAGILLWSSTQNNETGGLFASYVNGK